MGYEVNQESGRLVVTGSRTIEPLDVVAGILLLGLPTTLMWLVSLYEAERVTVTLVLAGVAVGLFLLMRAHVGHRAPHLVLDRAADAVTRAGTKLCAMSELDRVELHRHLPDENEAMTPRPIFQVGLVLAGLRGRGAPHAAPSSFEDAIEVAESTSEEEMRSCASSLAAYAGLRIEESGW